MRTTREDVAMPMPSRASAVQRSATFMEFVIHPVSLRTSAGPSTSEHHSPNGHWSPTTRTTPGLSRITRDIPSFLHARGVHEERISRHRSDSCTTHTQRSSVACPHVPTPSTVRNHSPNSATVRTLRNVGIQQATVASRSSDTHGLSDGQLPC